VSGYLLGQPYGHGRTYQHTVLGTTPGAGANYSTGIGRVDRARLVFASFTLTTDSNVAARYVTIEYGGINAVARTADGAAVTVSASTTAQRFLGIYNRGPAEWNTGTDVFFPLGGLWIEAGETVAINVANIQVGDQLASIRLTFDRVEVAFDGSREAADARAENELLGG
jgi:hypothetical protein